MKGANWFYRSTVATLVGLILVVLAGSLVKATDSGMGCPDWPKCYGHLIPPMDSSKVIFHPEHEFFQGQMIIFEGRLWKAKQNFTSTTYFDESDWIVYDKHGYAIYNPTHTLIEYINRMVSVLVGFTTLGMLLFSFSYRKTKPIIPVLSIITFILLLFEAWLGRIVVDSVLSPVKISLHLYAAYLIIFTTTIALPLSSSEKLQPVSKSGKRMITIAFVLLLLQLFLGAKLREVFDVYYQTNNLERTSWINSAGLHFLIHRSFSLVYLLFIILGLFKLKPYFQNNRNLKRGMLLIGSAVLLEILTGVTMDRFNVPRFAQPAHVLLSSILLSANSYLWVYLSRSPKV